MSDEIVLGKKAEIPVKMSVSSDMVDPPQSRAPDYNALKFKLDEASSLVDNVVLKNYLNSLSSFEIIPLEDKLKKIGDIRIFKITEMVYQKDEYSTYKFATVFSALQNLNCGIFILINSNSQKTDFYMGVRSFDSSRTTKSIRDTLKNALTGQFPGVKTENLLDPEAEKLLSEIPRKNIASVSCVARNKNEEFNNNEVFIQGLEKLTIALQGYTYTGVVLAKGIPFGQLNDIRASYEQIFTNLSPFANMQTSYGTNTALSISEAFSRGSSYGVTDSVNFSDTVGNNSSKSIARSESVSKQDALQAALKGVGGLALTGLSLLTAPLTGGASIAAAAAIGVGQVALGAFSPKTTTTGTTETESYGESSSRTQGNSHAESKTDNESETKTSGATSGTNESVQLTVQNKSLISTLEKIDKQLKRIDECESLGMWESAAYFLSDSQETTEMAAGTYRALMRGENSGVETSAINFWGRGKEDKLPLLREYITNFIHPLFVCDSSPVALPVNACALVSSNELSIQMGLPRKSVCGFPVIEHADFGKEVVRYSKPNDASNFCLGNVYNMGVETDTEVSLDCNSLTMHTFVTGSTGAGKSNTVYEILYQLRSIYRIPFLIIEPAKGEYKNVFGHFADVSVYGTNPKKTELLRINPFEFPTDIHVLEHLDRLVEIFNVCWPMYAAMPAILKDAMERAYKAVGWELENSENPKGNVYPNFRDLLEQIESVISESKYSSDSKGDYSGALLTRVHSLTNGLNGLIFCGDSVDDHSLFDESVIVDLSRVGSAETKSLIMGILVMKLNEYRMCSGISNSPLKHITVLEEAHNLLKRTSTEQSSESSNLLGKSVELLTNSIAEMRTYGEGFIIADQSPGLLDASAIRNTNTKIILRLPDIGDRELVGYAAGLDKNQIDELAKLKKGVAAVYQNDWVSPVLVQIGKCPIKEQPYSYNDCNPMMNKKTVCHQLIRLLIQGRVYEKLSFSVAEIEDGINALGLSASNREFVEQMIDEYNSTERLKIWEDANFKKLSNKIVDILNVHNKIENAVLSAADFDELSDNLTELTVQVFPDASENERITLCQCFMRDLSCQTGDKEVRENIYKNWLHFISKRRDNQ